MSTKPKLVILIALVLTSLLLGIIYFSIPEAPNIKQAGRAGKSVKFNTTSASSKTNRAPSENDTIKQNLKTVIGQNDLPKIENELNLDAVNNRPARPSLK